MKFFPVIVNLMFRSVQFTHFTWWPRKSSIPKGEGFHAGPGPH